MSDGERSDGLFGHAWWEIATVAGYMGGFVLVAVTLDRIGMTRARPWLSLLLAVVVPLIPFVVLLLYSGRIQVNLGHGGPIVRKGGEEPTRERRQPSSTRRTIIEIGGVLATMGTSWRFITRGFDVKIGPVDIRYRPETDSPTSRRATSTGEDQPTPEVRVTTTERDTPTEPSDHDTSTEESRSDRETPSDVGTAYGRRAYGRLDYGG